MFWLNRIQLNRIAINDAKGAYGDFLINHQKATKKNPSAKIDFQPSDWMKYVAGKYTNTTERLINNNRRILKIVNRIKQCHSKFLETQKEFNNKKTAVLSQAAKIETETNKINVKIVELSQYLADFNEGKSLPSGLSLRKIKVTKEELEQKMVSLHAEKEKILDISSIQDEYERSIKTLLEEVRCLEADLSKQIDLLYNKIHKIEIHINEQIIYYWTKLCEYIQVIRLDDDYRYSISRTRLSQTSDMKFPFIGIEVSIRSLNDIAPLCGTVLKTKDDLFVKERTFINSTVNKNVDLQYEV